MTDFQTPRRAAPMIEAEDHPEYELLKYLPFEFIEFNIARLRGEAARKLKYADALEAFKNRPPF